MIGVSFRYTKRKTFFKPRARSNFSLSITYSLIEWKLVLNLQTAGEEIPVKENTPPENATTNEIVVSIRLLLHS